MGKRRAGLPALLVSAALGCAAPGDPVNSGAPASAPGTDRTEVLIFNGASAWEPEVGSLVNNLYAHGITYVQTTGPALDAMVLDELSRFGLLIFPGGNSLTMTASLLPETRSRIRAAVRDRGVNYLGFCAGAWLATSGGIGIVDGPEQEQTAMGREGQHFALNRARFPDGTQRELLWYGGPITPDVPGGVAARYADGKSAISQLRSGRGFVTLSGLHPTATTPILNALGLSSREAVAPDFAWKMLDSALHARPLPAFP